MITKSLTMGTVDGAVRPGRAAPSVLGEYVLAAGLCVEQAVESSVDRQQTLRAQGVDVPIGELLLESGGITRADLRKVLRQQDLDRLAASPLFQDLSQDTLLDIFASCEVGIHPAGAILCRQESQDAAVHVVLHGMVSLTHQAEDGREVGLGVVRAGGFFGEMSVLAESPVFLTVKALEKTKVATIPGELFRSCFRRDEDLTRTVTRKWFLDGIDSRLQGAVCHEFRFKELLSKKETLPCVQLRGETSKARGLRARIGALLESNGPVLLLGPPGSMKTRVAQHLYESGGYQGPFIVFDATAIPESVIEGLPGEWLADFRDEVRQIAALFGFASPERSGGGRMPWHGFLDLARNGVLVVKGVEALRPKTQALLAEFAATGTYTPLNGTQPRSSNARLVVCATDDLHLGRPLLRSLRPNTIRLGPLKDRKKDLKAIITSLTAEIARERKKKGVTGLDQEAMNTILAYDWPGNFRELEDVLRRGVNLSRGSILTSEEIFIGNVPITGKVAYNLLKIPLVRHLFESPFFPAVPRSVVAAMFAVVVLMGFFGDPSPDSNVSLLLVWANWEPLLIMSCFLVARMWCSFCPIGFISSTCMRVRHRFRIRIPPRLLNHGLYASAVGLALVFWSQASLDMWERPKETAGLLMVMLFSAAAVALLTEGRVWCRVLCPLGQMVAIFGRTSLMEVRSNANYCSHDCKGYECYTGRAGTYGCELAKGPFALETNQNCSLCGNCIKLCPNQSVRVNLRPPGWELWNSTQADLAALIFVPLLWATQLFRHLEGTPLAGALVSHSGSAAWAHGVLMLGSVLVGYGLVFAGMLATPASWSGGPTGLDRSVHVLALLPYVYLNEIALRLEPLLGRAADFFFILGNQLGADFPTIAFRLDLHSIRILQVVVVLTGAGLSGLVLARYRQRAGRVGGAAGIIEVAPLVTMTAVSLFFILR